jgi:hypothetical protein
MPSDGKLSLTECREPRRLTAWLVKETAADPWRSARVFGKHG